MLSIDKYTRIADAGHEVCEDYALCGTVDTPWGIVSDGCSSSENTHIGSLVLSHVAAQEMGWIRAKCPSVEGALIKYLPFTVNVANRLISKAEMLVKALGVGVATLDATLSILFKIEEKLIIFSYGDGSVLVKMKDGEDAIFDIDYASNAPCYINYLSNPCRMGEYKTLIQQADGKTTRKQYHIRQDGSIYCPYEDVMTPYEPFVYVFDATEVDFIAVASDGLSSFYKKGTSERLPVAEVAKRVMDIKARKGNFLQRRMKRVIRDLAKDGWQHSDDISISGMIIDHEVQS